MRSRASSCRVEGLVELVLLPEADRSMGMLRVYSEHVLNDAFPVYNYGGPPVVWCDKCEITHKPGEHVRP